MEQVEKTVEVNCPIRTMYNQWTQFEEFPQFMSGVKEVRQLDDTHVHWRAEIWGLKVDHEPMHSDAYIKNAFRFSRPTR